MTTTRKDEILQVRISRQERDQLREMCELYGQTQSTFGREAIMALIRLRRAGLALMPLAPPDEL